MALGAQGTVLGQAIFSLMVNDTEFGRQLDSANKMALERSAIIAQSLSTIGTAFTQAGQRAAGFIGQASVAFQESEKAGQRLIETLNIIGQDGAANFERVNEAIDKMSRSLVIDDEVLSDAFSNLAQRTGDTAIGLELVGIAADIAAAKGKPLEQVVQAVGRAYQGSDRALKMLGITMDSNLKGIDALREAGSRFAGAAERDAARHGKSWERVQIVWENVQEKFGAAMAPTLTSLAESLSHVLDRILAMDEGQMQAWGNALIWAAGIGIVGGKLLELGGSVLMATNSIRMLQLAQTAAAASATTAANATGGLLSQIRSIPAAVAVAIVAITALAAAYNKLAGEKMRAMEAAGSGGANINSGTDAMGNPLSQTSAEMSRDTAREGGVGWWNLWLPGSSGASPGMPDYGTGNAFLDSQRRIEESKEQIRNLYENRRQRSAPATVDMVNTSGAYRPGGNFSDTIKQQGQFAY